MTQKPHFDPDEAKEAAAKLGEILAGYWATNVESGYTGVTLPNGEKGILYVANTAQSVLGKRQAVDLMIDPGGKSANHIDTGKVLDRGTARKLGYMAGGHIVNHIQNEDGAALSSSTKVWVYYPGPAEAMLTPKKLPGIIERVKQKLLQNPSPSPSGQTSTQAELGLGIFLSDWPPMKGMGITAVSDHETSIQTWAKRKSAGTPKGKNPVLTGNLKGSKVNVYLNGKEMAGRASPESPEQLRAYLAQAFGPKAYAIILGLAYLGEMAKRSVFTVKLSELCKLIWGDKYKGGLKREVWETIEALHAAEIRLTQPNKQKGPEATTTYVYSPLAIEQFEQSSQGATPSTVKLALFPTYGEEGKNKLGPVAIPQAVLGLPLRDFAIVTYLLIEQKQGYQENDIKADLGNLMKAAGLGKTWKSNPRQAKQNLERRLQGITQVDLVGDFVGFEGNKCAAFRPSEALRQAITARKGGNTTQSINGP